MPKWINLKTYPGVRYYEHETRRHNNRPDRNYYIRYKRGGKLFEEPCGWASEGMTPLTASQLRGQVVMNIKAGKHPQSLKEAREIADEKAATEKLQAITFSEFWNDEYFPSCQAEKKDRSWQAEESWFKNWIKPAIGSTSLVDVSQIDIERIKNKMSKAGLTPRSAQYCIATIRQVFNMAARRGLFRGDNPTKGIKVKVGDNRRVKHLEPEMADALLAELMRRSLQLHDIALLSLRCGLRAGEIFSLSWDCVDFEQGTLFIKDTKSGKNRHAYMTADVKKMLMIRYQGVDTGLVFTDRKGSRIQMISASFFRAVDALGLNAGIEDPRQKVVFHTLRHTFASWLVQDGQPLYTVAKLLGHSTIAMTERYSHLAPGNMRGAVEQMEKRLKEQKNGIVIKLHRK